MLNVLVLLVAVQNESTTLEGHMATTSITRITLRGKSGASYDFEVYPWGQEFRPVGAVYAVLRERADGRYDVLYIGQTGDLSDRFANHHRQGCFDRNGKTHVGVHQESSEQRRLSIEKDLIDGYDPPCNRQ